MNELFLPYKESIELKELGFDERTLAYWFNETPTNPEGQCIVYYEKPWNNEKILKGVIIEYYSAPTFSQAFKFFREKYDIQHSIKHWCKDDKIREYYYEIGYTCRNTRCGTSSIAEQQYNMFKYEEAELECLRKIIEIIKTEKISTIKQ